MPLMGRIQDFMLHMYCTSFPVTDLAVFLPLFLGRIPPKPKAIPKIPMLEALPDLLIVKEDTYAIWNTGFALQKLLSILSVPKDDVSREAYVPV